VEVVHSGISSLASAWAGKKERKKKKKVAAVSCSLVRSLRALYTGGRVQYADTIRTPSPPSSVQRNERKREIEK